jgi:hypothetical protein
MPRIRLNTIKCTVPDEIDKDEMYLKHNGKKFWPHGSLYFRVDVDDTVEIDEVMEVDEGFVEIEVWDFDYTSTNDHLGTFRFKVDDSPGKYSTSMTINPKKTKTASYFLMWEILED